MNKNLIAKYLILAITILLFASCGDDACDKGYEKDGGKCVNINECESATLNNCNEANATCTDTEGSFECACNTGYTGDGITCKDIDECKDDTLNDCGEHSKCTNTIGKFKCDCDENFYDVDTDRSNGCEYACTPAETGSELCGEDNNCDGIKTENSADLCGDNSVCLDSKCVLSELDSVASGENHFCAISGTKVFCWGDNSSGQITGTPSVEPILTPVEVDLKTISGKSEINEINELALGSDFSCVLMKAIDKNIVTCWGNILTDNVVISTGGDITSLKAGSGHICMIKANKVNCWGKNEQGQVGDGTQNDLDFPGYVPGLSNVKAISLGQQHSCAIEEDGKVKCWGFNKFKQLGANVEADFSVSPVAVLNTDDSEFSADSLSLGKYHSCAISGDRVFCWGNSSAKEIGPESNYPNPTKILNLDDEMYSTPLFMNNGAMSSFTCLKPTEDKNIECRGANSNKQIQKDGAGIVPNYSFEGELEAITEKGMATSPTTSCVLINAKTKLNSDNDINVIECKGNNDFGQLGNNLNTDIASFDYVLK